MKKEEKLQKNKLLKQKENYKKIIDYLVDSYYLNPKKELTIEMIRINLKMLECPILSQFIEYLGEENYIIYVGTSKDKFIINYKGFIYLENLQKDNKKYENNLINIVITISAFIISIYALWGSAIMVVMGIIFAFVILIIILKLTK